MSGDGVHTEPYDDLAHFGRLYESAPREFAFSRSGARDPASVRAWQLGFRERLREATGLAAMERDLAGYVPRAERASVEDVGPYLRERWHLWTEPDVPLPFWLLLPKGGGRRPLVLTPHGHGRPDTYVGIAATLEDAKSIAEGERDVAVQAVSEGCVTIAPAVRAFGGTRARADRERDALSSCRIELMHGLLVGRTPVGERVWDTSRLIDWAAARDDVDAARIAITGNSGGGTVSLWSAALDERISVAVPSCSFCTFAGSIGSIHHCDCNYVPGVLRLGEMYDVAGLAAPRPFLAIAGLTDDIFPVEHVRAAFEELRRVYEAAGAGDHVELFVGEGGHRYYKSASWPFVRRWFGPEGR